MPVSHSTNIAPASSSLESLTGMVGNFARWIRTLFDRCSEKLAPSVVAMLALVVILATPKITSSLATTISKPSKAELSCTVGMLPINPLRLQATFSAERFTSLIRAEGDCVRVAQAHFDLDTPFAIAYGLLLPFVFIWIERWRRFRREGAIETVYGEGPKCLRNDFLIAAPLLAAAFDVGENVSLGLAIRGITEQASASMTLVAVGSLLATLKWIALVIFSWGTIAEFMSGPRGRIASLLRCSVIGAMISTIPLVLVDQGQEILQRAAESREYISARFLSILGMWLVALAVWYLGRVLIYLHFDRLCKESDREVRENEGLENVAAIDRLQIELNTSAANSDLSEAQQLEQRNRRLADLHEQSEELKRKITARESWLKFFAEYLPRLTGIAVLFMGALAFAKLGLSVTPFLIAGAFGVLVVILTEWRVGKHPVDWIKANGVNWRLTAAVVAAVVPTTIVSRIVSPDDYVLSRLLNSSMWTLASAWIFYAFVEFRSQVAWTKSRIKRDHAYSSQRQDWRGPTRVGVAVSAGFLILFAYSNIEVARNFGSVLLLALAAMNAVFFGTVFLHKAVRYKVPIVRIALVLAVLFSVWNDNHRTTELRTDDSAERAADAARIRARSSLTKAFTNWSAPDSASKKPIIVVATAGGGLRAAYWTAAVLAALQDSNPNFADHVFAISSVSGGSLGSALFVGLVKDKLAESKTAPCTLRKKPIYTECVREYMADDHLSPLLSKLLAPDFAQRFIPIAVPSFDRSIALEDSWTESYITLTGNETFRRGVMAFNPDSQQTRLPVMLLNTTHVESGRRFITSPVKFDGEIRDAGDVLSDLKADLKLAAAVHNSARFTLVSPPGRLGETDTHGRLVDGGYFENSGLVTAQEVYNAIRTAPGRGSRPIYLVYLCNDPIHCAQDTKPVSSAADDSAAVVHATWGNEIAGPVRALLSVRDGRASLARAQVSRSMANGDSLLQLNVCDNQTFSSPFRWTQDTTTNIEIKERARERVVSPPLGWMLSRLAIAWMDTSLSYAADTSRSPCRRMNAANMKFLKDVTK